MSRTQTKAAAPVVEAGKVVAGMRGVGPVGFTVPDLDQAVDFLCDVLGCEPTCELGSLARADAGMACLTKLMAIELGPQGGGSTPCRPACATPA